MHVFETSQCSGQNSSNSSCQLWNQMSISFQILHYVMTHNSSVKFNLMHFLLWIKGFHQNLNSESFEYSGENLPNSSCRFPNHKSVFLKILDHSSVSWNNNLPVLILAQTLHTLVKKGPLKCRFLRLLSVQVRICQIPHINFETTSQSLFKFCIILQCHEI